MGVSLRINKKILSVLLVLTLTACFASGQSQEITPLYETGTETSLNGTWKFKYIEGFTAGSDSMFYLNDFDVSGWDNIKVPGHWGLQGFTEPTYGELPAGLGLYKRSFRISPEYKGQQVFIRFEGVLFAYEVFVNGKKAGEWGSSYNGASFNITKLVYSDEPNLLAVRVSTRSKEYRFDLADNWALTGIYRDVELFSTPNVYIDDYTVQTFVPGDHSGIIKLETKMHPSKQLLSGNRTLQVLLYSPEGKLIHKEQEKVVSETNNFEFSVSNPGLWTAETPILYSIKLLLLKDGKKQQEICQKVGIREITIEEGILKLNGKAIKLRGVNTHDLIPETGKTLSLESIKKDLELIKKGNIDFIRTSHYPPDRRKLDLCDSLGIYVVCEVPFAFGSEFLNDTSYRHFLIRRADATVKRDKNHPSVILWSLGNENPMTQITEETGDYVKKKDPTRPVLFAGYGDLNKMPDCVDIFSRHYGMPDFVRNFADEKKYPVIMTEYAHGLGLSFGNLEDVWDEMFRRDNFAGGAIWHFQDQGVFLKAKKPVDRSKLAYNVWTDSIHYYKTTLEGTDGIVYADRTPQVDFWQTRKVYSPIQVIEDRMTVVPGKQQLNFTARNQYDFTDLNTLSGTWKLYKNNNVYREGTTQINCAPHDTARFSLSVCLPENAEESIWYLRFEYRDQKNCSLYGHNTELVTASVYKAVAGALCNDQKTGKCKAKSNKDKITVQTKSFVYEIDKNKSFINIFSTRDGKSLLSSPLYARTGRFPKMADVTVRDKHYPEDHDYYWAPWLLEPTNAQYYGQGTKGDGFQVAAKETFVRGKDFPGEKIDGELQYFVNKNGSLEIGYHMVPVNATGVFLEAGVSLVMPKEYDYFYWVGDGPFSSYPDKHRVNGFGIYKIHKDDINFNGNRTHVKVSLVMDSAGNGIAVLGNSGNISVELKDGCIVLSQNILLSGLGNKKKKPLKLIQAKEVEKIEGVLKLIPLKAGQWPEILKDMFGGKQPKPFNPYYYSYDTSK